MRYLTQEAKIAPHLKNLSQGYLAQMVKKLLAMQKTLHLIPGLGRFPKEGKDNSLQYSCLENSMDRGTWWATVRGVAKNQTQLSN